MYWLLCLWTLWAAQNMVQCYVPSHYDRSTLGSSFYADHTRNQGLDKCDNTASTQNIRQLENKACDANMKMVHRSGQEASDIAQQAARDAEAANWAQVFAAKNASKFVLQQLAKKAIQAAQTAEAVLEGKEALVMAYEKEAKNAEEAYEKMSAMLENSKEKAERFNDTVNIAAQQMVNTKVLIQQAYVYVHSLEKILKQVQNDIAEKEQCVSATEKRADRLGRQLFKAKKDFEKIKFDAYKANCMAKKARENAEKCQQ